MTMPNCLNTNISSIKDPDIHGKEWFALHVRRSGGFLDPWRCKLQPSARWPRLPLRRPWNFGRPLSIPIIVRAPLKRGPPKKRNPFGP